MKGGEMMQKIRDFLPRVRKRRQQIIHNVNENPTIMIMPYIFWRWNDWDVEHAAAWVLVVIMLLLGRISSDLRIFIRFARVWFVVQTNRYAERKRAEKAEYAYREKIVFHPSDTERQ